MLHQVKIVTFLCHGLLTDWKVSAFEHRATILKAGQQSHHRNTANVATSLSVCSVCAVILCAGVLWSPSTVIIMLMTRLPDKRQSFESCGVDLKGPLYLRGKFHLSFSVDHYPNVYSDLWAALQMLGAVPDIHTLIATICLCAHVFVCVTHVHGHDKMRVRLPWGLWKPIWARLFWCLRVGEGFPLCIWEACVPSGLQFDSW